MANKNLFKPVRPYDPKPTDTTNLAGGIAYSLGDKEALAQLIVTGTFNSTFYADAKQQVDTVTKLLNKLGPDQAEFVAKLAIYAREYGYMKDTPAFLMAWLSVNGPQYLNYNLFNRVIDNGKMLRNFVQIMRSGAVGRKSLGTLPKKLIQNWLNTASADKLLRASVGNDPSLADIIKMVHPCAPDQERNEFYRWLLGKPVTVEMYSLLPANVTGLIDFRKGDTLVVPKVPFELLTSLELSTNDWVDIAMNAGWQMTRMNLNTFSRNGILNAKVSKVIADRLADPEKIANSRVMPYQLFTTWLNIGPEIPVIIKNALEKALDVSLSHVPRFSGKKVWVFVDVSGSMSSAITGERKGSTSRMRCVDVAALIASSILRANPENTNVTMFDTKVHLAGLNPNGSVMENAQTIARFGGGGTACQLPLQALVNARAKGDLIIYISDNESWFYPLNTNRPPSGYCNVRGTGVAEAWAQFKRYNPEAKMVCIDLVPNRTTQAPNSVDVLNVGGFNDAVYGVIESFLEQGDWNAFINGVQF